MGTSRQEEPDDSMSGKLTKPFRFLSEQFKKHVGYDVAMKGWDNDKPMSGSPRLKALREVFNKNAKKIPFMVISPVLWSEMASDISKAIAPDKDSKLLPQHRHSSLANDLAYFRPDEDYKKRLERSTSLETSRGFTRSFLKVVGMYLTKAGPKELAIATSLAALTLYTSYESVNVLAEFSNWGRDFNNFYVGAGTVSQAVQSGILDALKAAYSLDSFVKPSDLVQAIVDHASYNMSVMDVNMALSGVKISPEMVGHISDLIQGQMGSLSLDVFMNGAHEEELRNILAQTDLPFEQAQEVVDAIYNGVHTKISAGEAIQRIQEQFSGFDFDTFNSQLAEHAEKTKSVQEAIGSLRHDHQDAVRALQETLGDMSLPENIEKVKTLIAQQSGEIGQMQEKLTELKKGYDEITGPLQTDLNMLLAPDVLNAAGVGKNTSYLAGNVPGQFGMLLGKFLAYALPSFYFAQHLALRWQTWMTGKLTNEWRKYNSAYKIKFQHTNIDNVDQRIEQNLSSITEFVVSTTTEGMQNGLQLAIFLPMLGAMGSFNPAFLGGPDITINNFLTWTALGYAAVGTGALGAIAYNLPHLKRRMQETNANFRATLMSFGSQPEQISLARGDELEKKILKEKFRPVVDVQKKLINKGTQMMTFNSIHGNVGSYIPLLLAAPQYFAGLIDFGQVSQAAGIFRRVEGAFEFFKSNISSFTSFKAALDRTAQLTDALELSRYEELEKLYYQNLAQAQEQQHVAPEAPEPASM